MGLQFCNEMILATVSILSNQSSISSETQSQVKIWEQSINWEFPLRCPSMQDEDTPERSQTCGPTEDLTDKLGCYITPFKIGQCPVSTTSFVLSRVELFLDIGSSLPPTIRLQPTRWLLCFVLEIGIRVSLTLNFVNQGPILEAPSAQPTLFQSTLFVKIKR